MKKIILSAVIGVVVLLIIAAIAVGLFLDKAIKSGVETVGPMLTKTDVELNRVSLSLWSGSGKIQGLVVANPPGYQTTSAIKVGSASLQVRPGSLFSDKVVVNSIDIQGPEVTFETDFKGNNLSKLLANIEAATGGEGKEKPAETEPAASRKLQVNDLVVSGGKVNVSVTGLMGGKSAVVALPEIHLTNLGTGPEGITAAELSKLVLNKVLQAAAQASASAVADLAKDASGLTKELDKAVPGASEKATKALGDLFKKK